MWKYSHKTENVMHFIKQLLFMSRFILVIAKNICLFVQRSNAGLVYEVVPFENRIGIECQKIRIQDLRPLYDS